VSPSSALTRFLKQGLARGMCPLCRVAHKLDREYIWYFFDVYSGQDEALDALRGAHGFCFEHAQALRRLEVDGLKSTLGISTTYLDTIEGLAEQLSRLGTKDHFTSARCPACAYRDEGVEKNARYLLDELAENEQSRERFTTGPGLCMPHFELVWVVASGDERAMLIDVEHRNAERLASELREHIRKQGAEFKDEPQGAEADAWERALALTGGWPPPSAPVGEPEDDRG
jgi:hypothetical protein